MNPLAPLLAAGIPLDELIKFGMFVLIIIIAVIAQLVAKLRQIQPPGGAPRPPAPVPPDVANEIEKFLRRAATRRTPEPVARPAQPPPAAEPIQAEVVAERPVGGQVGEHVKKYLDAEVFTRRGDELGKEVVQEVDKEIDQHLHQVFDHAVSKLEAVPGVTATPPMAYEPPNLVGAAEDIPDSFATGLLELVASPDSLRQAIILNEILHRPEERWA